ncbi:serine acetyltransferase [Vibrio cholerae]|uniref:serine O-acetyltransferase n=1 Tax=Vibrio cholerae TaxID=666 RepID=UPI0004E3DE00|nr:serine acetyltransferase [Vibrio cholerae]MDF4532555.1 serine acetyltransferase [Vibrio parahaemolyticus]EGR1041679.1 serine acetyltransferase [Vibrio cholerae]EGR1090921.1 serine acetyltransferase [Vibrio cholerae]EGR2495648.1 serine acetyltransferase [Vibrio cholerae]EJL6653321.1 serine acetyltransferase [Vibrio cholerae]
MILYSVGRWFYKNNIPIIPLVFNFLIRFVHNSAVYCQSEIGKGTVFGYGGIAVVIHKRSVIGKECVIGSNVTIGGRSRSEHVPVIGDHVYIATGAKILGDIHVGDGAVIGANAVVLEDVPAYSVVVGIPAKVIKTDIDPKDFY